MKSRTTRPSNTPIPVPPIGVTLLEQLFDQSPDVTFFVKDVDGRYLSANDSLAIRHGLKHKSQVIGKRPSDICPGDLGRIPSEQDAAVIRTGRPLLNHLELHWYQPHKPGWCLTTKLPIHAADGAIAGVIGISRDVRVPIEPDEIPPNFAAAITAMEQNLDDPITPALLALRSKLSQPRLARLTKRLFGLTPSHFITKTRLTAAARLLRETNRTVAEIALACGFYDHSAFTRAFRAATGVTPTEFRG
ncbi:MAG: AraC family transcriptional regulator [Planctomycetes bacterium]|nr:AraC family transcriptional regulator [Planctomycetota bacterium]